MPDDDRTFYVIRVAHNRIYGPYPTREAAERMAEPILNARVLPLNEAESIYDAYPQEPQP